MLELRNVESGYFKQVLVLKGVSLRVEAGRCVAVLGSNGAGKSTLLRTIMGLIDDEPRKGSVLFLGREVSRQDAERTARAGLAYVIEGRGIFAGLTVLDNLMLGAYHRPRGKEVNGDLGRIYAMFPRLEERKRQPAGTMSGGEQQMLALGRALMSRPRLLMLDEPSLGLAPMLVEEIFGVIRSINDSGTGILLVEQNAHQALAIADYGYVLEAGRIVLEGSAEALRADGNVQELYLGTHTVQRGRVYAGRRRRRWN
jgi:branched-chain amino acid transport system ATP-binding protein